MDSPSVVYTYQKLVMTNDWVCNYQESSMEVCDQLRRMVVDSCKRLQSWQQPKSAVHTTPHVVMRIQRVLCSDLQQKYHSSAVFRSAYSIPPLVYGDFRRTLSWMSWIKCFKPFWEIFYFSLRNWRFAISRVSRLHLFVKRGDLPEFYYQVY